MTPTRATARPRLADLPELATRIGLHGSMRQMEVGGGACFAVVITTAIATQMPAAPGPGSNPGQELS